MSTPIALAAVAALAAAVEISKRGSRSNLSANDKSQIIELVENGQIAEARELSESLGDEYLDLIGAHLTWANLSEVDLSEADLCEADLREVDLFEADLTEANLFDASLDRANLTRSNLTGANLTEASLIGANLTGANLTGANLIGASLIGANLIGANLTGADLEGATLGDATAIDMGPNRVFKGTPDGYRIQRSRLSDRTTLAPVAPPGIADLRLAARRLRRGASIGEAYGFDLYSGD